MMGMECKVCGKEFCNGKALGGHMRSHFATLPVPPKTPQRQELSEPLTESTSCDERESNGDKSFLSAVSYGLGENPKKMADPEFFDAVVDRGSQSESTRASCKRAKPMTELEMEEKDVALCLIMLSRDVWRSPYEMSPVVKKVYECEKCGKILKSPQGLGSHRSSHHKKIKNISIGEVVFGKVENSVVKDQKIKNSFGEVVFGKAKNISVVKDEQVHECALCGKNFKSAQALGGHKRSHLLPSKFGTSLVENAPIDLNLPPQIQVGDQDSVGL